MFWSLGSHVACAHRPSTHLIPYIDRTAGTLCRRSMRRSQQSMRSAGRRCDTASTKKRKRLPRPPVIAHSQPKQQRLASPPPEQTRSSAHEQSIAPAATAGTVRLAGDRSLHRSQLTRCGASRQIAGASGGGGAQGWTPARYWKRLGVPWPTPRNHEPAAGLAYLCVVVVCSSYLTEPWWCAWCAAGRVHVAVVPRRAWRRPTWSGSSTRTGGVPAPCAL